ncbi:hypothetical protein NM688_g129 [Phlebia brevispora]|uniref:Uncharacterized protein n=1 Tax=Phlebia brevispora TaxID=194682 RepID=A0ACC1TFF3_9APHY|nr:hypothetical protein NM688_g129 [Phlebia brevispora]
MAIAIFQEFVSSEFKAKGHRQDRGRSIYQHPTEQHEDNQKCYIISVYNCCFNDEMEIDTVLLRRNLEAVVEDGSKKELDMGDRRQCRTLGASSLSREYYLKLITIYVGGLRQASGAFSAGTRKTQLTSLHVKMPQCNLHALHASDAAVHGIVDAHDCHPVGAGKSHVVSSRTQVITTNLAPMSLSQDSDVSVLTTSHECRVPAATMHPPLLLTTDIVVDTPRVVDGEPLKMVARRYSLDSSPTRDGLTLLCLHGVGCHKEHWEPTIERLFQLQVENVTNFTIREVWALDWQTHGDSAVLNAEAFAKPHSRATMADWAEAIVEFVYTRLASHRVVGIGHSAGVTTLLYSMSSYRDVTNIPYECVILIEPSIVDSSTWAANPDDRQRAAAFVETIASRQNVWDSRETAHTWFLQRKPWNSLDPRIVHLWADDGLRLMGPGETRVTTKCSRTHHAESCMERQTMFQAVDQIARICNDLPIHAIYGEIKDSALPSSKECFTDVSKGRKLASVSVVSDAGHMVLQQQPDRVGDLMHDILTNLVQRNSGLSTTELHHAKLYARVLQTDRFITLVFKQRDHDITDKPFDFAVPITLSCLAVQLPCLIPQGAQSLPAILAIAVFSSCVCFILSIVSRFHRAEADFGLVTQHYLCSLILYMHRGTQYDSSPRSLFPYTTPVRMRPYDYLRIIRVSESAIKIEVPKNWRWWSGWTSGRVFDESFGWIMEDDPMDKEGFDEEVAFPGFKPSAGVFQVGLPNRSRKQRGWYHVRSSLSSLARVRTREEDSLPTTGADIPPELFDVMFDCIQADSDRSSLHAVRMSKRELGNLALVCRRWTDIFRRKIFETITVRSREDVGALLSFVRPSERRIIKHIGYVVVSQPVTQYPYQPWTHTLPITDIHEFSKWGTVSTSMLLIGPLPKGRFMRSISAMLPRFVPGFFSGICQLELKNLHFRNINDLLWVPRELPSLLWVKCNSVTWDHASEEEQLSVSSYLVRERSESGPIDYTLRGCTDNAAAGWFAALLSPRRRDRLSQDDAHNICGIASAIVKSVNAAQFPEYKVKADRRENSLRFGAWHTSPLTPDVSVHFAPKLAGEDRRVRAIAIAFFGASVSELTAHSDWEAIDAFAAALPTLESLLISFQSRDDVPLFHELVTTQRMPHLVNSIKLKYSALSVARGGYTIVSSEGRVCELGCCARDTRHLARASPKWKPMRLFVTNDAQAICHIASALLQNISQAENTHYEVHAWRGEDSLGEPRSIFDHDVAGLTDQRRFIGFSARNTDAVLSDFQIFLTRPVAGQVRRVRGILLEVMSFSEMHEHSDWESMDELVVSLPSLETLLISSEFRDDIPLFHKEVVVKQMANCIQSKKVKYALQCWDNEICDNKYTLLSCSEDKDCTMLASDGSSRAAFGPANCMRQMRLTLAIVAFSAEVLEQRKCNFYYTHGVKFIVQLIMRIPFSAIVFSAILASATATNVHTRQTFPSCANICVLDPSNTFGCSPTDDLCLCNNQQYIQEVTQCFNDNCSPSDAQSAEYLVQQICLQLGVTLTLTATVVPSATAAVLSFLDDHLRDVDTRSLIAHALCHMLFGVLVGSPSLIFASFRDYPQPGAVASPSGDDGVDVAKQTGNRHDKVRYAVRGDRSGAVRSTPALTTLLAPFEILLYAHPGSSPYVRDLIILPFDNIAVMENGFNREIVQTSESIIKLDVPRNWQMWSGWRPGWLSRDDIKAFLAGRDPMDSEDFDEATIFPTYKPDIDVFHVGVPSYSRNQRGWYHINHWPRLLPIPPPLATRSTAVSRLRHVPPGSFDVLLRYIDVKREFNRHTVPMNKQELGSIALVCRRWADVTQAKISEAITLRSREDVDSLASLLSNPRTHVTKYIQNIVLSHSFSRYPNRSWIHTVSSAVPRALWRQWLVSVSLNGPLPPGQRMRSLCELPRPFPWGFVGISSLELEGLHFERPSDLIQVPRDLPSLRVMNCTNVTWNCSPDDGFPVLSYLTRKTLQRDWQWNRYRFRGCTDNSGAAWCSILLAARREDRLDHADARLLCRLASAFVRNIDMAEFPDYEVEAGRYEDFLCFEAWCKGPLTPNVHVYLTPQVVRRARCVRAIKIDFPARSALQMICHSDWRTIDAVAASLPLLETLLIRMDRDELPLFHNEIMKKEMPNFEDSAKLTYAVELWDREQKKAQFTPVSYCDDEARDVEEKASVHASTHLAQMPLALSWLCRLVSRARCKPAISVCSITLTEEKDRFMPAGLRSQVACGAFDKAGNSWRRLQYLQYRSPRPNRCGSRSQPTYPVMQSPPSRAPSQPSTHPGWQRRNPDMVKPSVSVFRLQVPRSWWKRSVISTGEERIDEDAAFPLLKPSPDIFQLGVPDYSRNQRGWYHIRPWPPKPLSIPRRDKSSAAAAGAAVPQELFDTILKYINLTTPGMNKRDLGHISLVCRRWAHTIQPWVFKIVTLRSYEDMKTLIAFLRHPQSRISKYIEYLDASPSFNPYPYLPWIHHVPAAFNPVLSGIITISLVLKGPLPARKFVKSVCDTLPRSISWCFSGIETLRLEAVHFRNLGDLVRLPRELPSLRRVFCSNVTWERAEDDEVFPAPSVYHTRTWSLGEDLHYSVRQCQDNVLAMWFAVLLAPRTQDKLAQDDAHLMCRLMSALIPNNCVYASGDEEVGALRLDGFIQFRSLRHRPSPRVPKMSVYFTPLVAGQARRVRTLVIDLRGFYIATFTEYADWKTTGSIMAALPSLSTVLILFKSREHVLFFHKQIAVQQMLNLLNSGQLKYVVAAEVPTAHRYTLVSYSDWEDEIRDVGRPATTFIEFCAERDLYARNTTAMVRAMA